MHNAGLFSVSKASERLKEEMISDKELSIDELDPDFKTSHRDHKHLGSQFKEMSWAVS